MKKILMFIIPLLLVLVLVGCGKNKIKPPKELALNEDVLVWGEVKGSDGYIVVVDKKEYPITAENFDLSELVLENGDYKIVVYAVKGDKRSKASKSVTYSFFYDVDRNEMLARLLEIIDEDYRLNMNEDDFDFLYQYDEYVDALETAIIIVDVFLNNKVSEEKMSSLMTLIADISNDDDDQFTIIKNTIEGFFALNLGAKTMTDFMVAMVKRIAELLEDEGEVVSIYQMVLENEADAHQLIYQVVKYLKDAESLLNWELIDNLKELFEGGDVDEEELFEIMQNFLTAFKNKLPNQESFQLFYQALFALVGSFLEKAEFDFNIDVFNEEVVTLAKVSRNRILVSMKLMLSFDFNYFSEIKEISENNHLREEEIALEVFLKSYQVIKGFLEDNKELIEEIPHQEFKAMSLKLFEALIPIMLENITAAFYSEDLDLITEIIVNSYGSLLDLNYYGEDFIFELLDLLFESDGSLVRLLLENNNLKNQIKFFEELMIEVIPYLKIANRALLDDKLLPAIIEVLELPFIISMEDMENISEYHNFYSDVKDDLKELLILVVELEDEYVIQLENYSFNEQASIWGSTFEEALILTQIMLINENILKIRVEEIVAKVDVILTKIDEAGFDVFDEGEKAEVISELYNIIDEIYDGLAEFKDWDYEGTLTEDQLEQLNDFLDGLDW